MPREQRSKLPVPLWHGENMVRETGTMPKEQRSTTLPVLPWDTDTIPRETGTMPKEQRPKMLPTPEWAPRKVFVPMLGTVRDVSKTLAIPKMPLSLSRSIEPTPNMLGIGWMDDKLPKTVDISNLQQTYNQPTPSVPSGRDRHVVSYLETKRKMKEETHMIPINPPPLHDDNMLEISSEDEDSRSILSRLSHNREKRKVVATSKEHKSVDEKLVSKLLEMFPDALPKYVKSLCVGRKATPTDVEAVLQIMFNEIDYPKRHVRNPSPDPDLDLEEQVSLLKEILPDADPNYLQYNAELYINDKDKLKEFMSNALELRNYPTLKEYIRKQQLSAQVKQYTTEFNIEKFLEIIPEPDTYFNDPNKKSSLIEQNGMGVLSLHYATRFLKNQYPNVPVRTINNAMTQNRDNLTRIVKDLDGLVEAGKGLLRTKRKPISIDSTIQNIPLLQEIAYLSHCDEIKEYLQEREAKEKKEKEFAKSNGLLRVCQCCFNDEVMPKSIVKCENGCDFCNECVKTSAEILLGEGKLEFPCLQTCTAFFSLQTLKDVLSPKLFSKMAQRKQLEEVKAAGIDELEMCPFCDFATIPAPGDKLFRCLNPECMKESCRQCKEPSHVPLKCDEIEKDDDVKRRTYIENKMTEALLRVCYKCGMKFIKADGCNKMTCSCGAMMCYVCGKPVTDYKHFNGQGGDKFHLCPLYSDTNKLHQEAVIKGAEQAKAEVGVAEDPRKLKIDPTADLDRHYKTKKPKHHAPNYNVFVEVEAARVRLEQVNQQLIAAIRNPNLAPRDVRNRGHHHHHHHHHPRCHRHPE